MRPLLRQPVNKDYQMKKNTSMYSTYMFILLIGQERRLRGTHSTSESEHVYYLPVIIAF